MISRLIVAFFVLTFCAGGAGAQALDGCDRYWALLSDLRVTRNVRSLDALAAVTPVECSTVQKSIADFKASLESPWRVALADGSVVMANAPPLVRDDDQSNWPVAMSRELLVAAPNAKQIDDLMPARARAREKVGAVVMEGRVQPDGTFVWRITYATPEGWGFEDAAVRVGALYRAPLKFADGRRTVGTAFNTVIGFAASASRPRYYQ